MKKYLFILLLFTGLFYSQANAFTCSRAASDSTQKTLPDGHYYADVDYYNYATQETASFSSVKIIVKEGIVRFIYLPNGSVLHDGINYQNYLYTGGKISGSKDKHSGKMEYTAKVSISNVTIVSYTVTLTKEEREE